MSQTHICVFPALYLESQARTQCVPEHTTLLHFRCGEALSEDKLNSMCATETIKMETAESYLTFYLPCPVFMPCSTQPVCMTICLSPELNSVPELLMCGERPARILSNNQIYSLDRLASFSSCSRSDFCTSMPWNCQCNIRHPCCFSPSKMEFTTFLRTLFS